MPPPVAGPSDPRKRPRKRGPRGLWNARTASRLPAQDARDTRHSPSGSNCTFESDIDDSRPSTPATRDDDDPFPIDTEDDQVHYFLDQPGHSRATSPYPKPHWIAPKIIDMSSTARGSQMDAQGPTFDRDDWEDLKDLFSKATELYQSELLITQP